jgi:hypothetical protein
MNDAEVLDFLREQFSRVHTELAEPQAHAGRGQ